MLLDLVEKMAKALQRFGMKRALVVHSDDLDEISPLASKVKNGSQPPHARISKPRPKDPLTPSIAAPKANLNILTESYIQSKYYPVAKKRIEEISRVRGAALGSRGSQSSFFMQALTLTNRSFVNMSRDFGYYWLRLVIYLLVTICIGTIYYDVGTKYNSIMARASCVAFIFGFVTFISIGGFPSFIEDMKVFHREWLNGHYGVSAFVISNTVSALSFPMMITFLSGTVCYFMARLHPGFTHYLFFVLSFYASVTVVESLMMVIASVVPNFLMGIIVGAGIQGVYMLVSGFFRLPYDIPKPLWRYPMSYISFHFWAIQGQFQNDMKGLSFDNQIPRATEDLRRIHTTECVRDRYRPIEMGRPLSSIQHDRDLSCVVLCHDQDQRGHQPAGSRLPCEEKTAA